MIKEPMQPAEPPKKSTVIRALQLFCERLSHVSYSPSLQVVPLKKHSESSKAPLAQSIIRCIIELTYLLNNSQIWDVPLDVKIYQSQDSIKALYREVKEGETRKGMKDLFEELFEIIDKHQQEIKENKVESRDWEVLMNFKTFVKNRNNAPSSEEIQSTQLFSQKSSFLRVFRNSLIQQLKGDSSESQSFTKFDKLKIRWLMELKKIMPATRLEQHKSLLESFNSIDEAYKKLFQQTKFEENKKLKTHQIQFVQNLQGFLFELGWSQTCEVQYEDRIVTLFYRKKDILGTQPITYRIMLKPDSPDWIAVDAISDLEYPSSKVYETQTGFEFNVHFLSQNCQLISQMFPCLSVFPLELKGKSFVTFRAEYNAPNVRLTELIDKEALLIEQATIALTLLKPLMKSGKNLDDERDKLGEILLDIQHYKKAMEIQYRMKFKDDIVVGQ